jgi:hypothetical protein
MGPLCRLSCLLEKPPGTGFQKSRAFAAAAQAGAVVSVPEKAGVLEDRLVPRVKGL